MKTRKFIQSALLLVLVAALTLEAALWMRAIGASWVQEAYPYVGVDGDGSPVYWRQWYREVRGRSSGYLRLYDENREVIREIDYAQPGTEVGAVVPQVTASAVLANRGAPWERFDDPPVIIESTRGHTAWRGERSWIEEVLFSLQVAQTRRSDRGAALYWSFENGRFYCQRRPGDETVAVLGAEGLGESSPPFGRMRFVKTLPHDEPDGSQSIHRHLLLDLDALALVDLTILSDGPRVPNRIFVKRRPLREPASLDGTTESLTGVIETDAEWLLADETGRILARAARRGDETLAEVFTPGFGSRGGRTAWYWSKSSRPVPLSEVSRAVLTTPRPVDPLVVRQRFHLLRAGRLAKVVETRLEPVTTWERILAGIALAPEFVRPLPLCVASMAAAPPDTWEECNSWWLLTPSMADGKRSGLLALVVLVSAIAAWVAWRWGRARCATVGQARLWAVAVFVLGPMGLLWMRLVLPRVRVETVGGARRAVNLDASPSSGEPWPEPVSTGI